MTRLSVNLNKVALLRNTRDVGYPSVLETASTVIKAGAHGITVHPRPDQRHIRRADVPALSAFLQDHRDIEFNIEGYPDEDFIDLVLANNCHQVTLVPDAPEQKTSDHGWDVREREEFLRDTIARLNDAGRRVSVFIDPDPGTAEAAARIGADRIELYTGPYAAGEIALSTYAAAAVAARGAGIGVNAGHDLNLDNLARFIAAIPDCDEVSIGHAITADALMMGWTGAVSAYLTAIKYGHKSARAA